MNKKSEYNKHEIGILTVSILFVALILALFFRDMTGFATRQTTEIIEINQTQVLVPVKEEPSEIQTTTEETPLAEVQAGCVVPSNGYSINSSLTLCKGTYVLTSGLIVRGSNIVLDCNGTTLISNDFYDTSKSGITSNKGNNNTIKNCNIVGFGSSCIDLTNFANPGDSMSYNSSIIYNNLSKCGGVAGIYISGVTGFNISYNKIFDLGDNGQGDLGSHAIYLSASNPTDNTSSGIISYNLIYNGSASGIKINPVSTISNILIFNNTIRDLHPTRGDDIGIHIIDSFNISIFNNIFSGNYEVGILINYGDHNISKHVHGINVFNNSFQNQSIGVQLRSGSYDNIIFNNSYKDIRDIEFSIHALANFSVYEYDNLRFQEQTSPYHYLLYLNFNGSKNFTINSYNFTIRNLLSPYNDIKNKSNGIILASNVDTYSKILVSGQQIEVGNFVADPEPPNNPPVMNSVTLSNNLTCVTSASDADGDSLTTTIQFYINGTLNKTVTGTSATQTNYSGTHYCRARAYDNEDYSNWVTSNSITVNRTNLPPTISNIQLTSDFNCSATITDPDSNISINLSFIRNNIIYETTNTSSAVINPPRVDYDVWKCNVTATDGTSTTRASSNTIQILINDPPTITASLTQINTSLKCEINITDPDSNSFTTTIDWYNNNTLINTTTATTTNTYERTINNPTNNIYTCNITVSDENYTTKETKSITYYYNTQPTISSITLSNNLTCEATISDIEGNLNTSLTFYKNNVLQHTENIITDSLASYQYTSVLNDLDSWHCNITVHDGNYTRTNRSNTIQILINDPPTITASLTQINTSLKCEINITDPDSNSFTTTIDWYNNNTLINTTTATTTNTYERTINNLTNNIYYCNITVSDENYTTKETRSITYYYNTQPTISSITLSNNLTCEASIEDTEGSVNVNLTFYKNNILQHTESMQTDNLASYQYTSLLNDLDSWYCNISADGIKAKSNTIQVLINDPPIINITLLSQYNSTFGNLSCIINITDPDSNIITTSIEWYEDDLLINQTSLVGKNLRSNIEPEAATYYCKATSNDSENSTTATSNSITIQNHEDIPTTINVTINNSLSCQAIIVDPDTDNINLTIHYYKDAILNATINTSSAAGTFIYTLDTETAYNQSWYCEINNQTSNTIIIPDTTAPNITLNSPINAYSTTNNIITFNYSSDADDCLLNINSQTTNNFTVTLTKGTYYWNISCSGTTSETRYLTITETKSKGGGGGGGNSGGGSYTPAENNSNKPIKTEKNVTTTKKSTEEKTATEQNPIIEETPKTVEQPKQVSGWQKYLSVYLGALIFFIILAIFIFKSQPIPTDERINQYIIRSLKTGYTYDAIRQVLKRYYSDTVIDHHFHILRMNNIEKSKTTSEQTITDRTVAINSIKRYINQQRLVGYREKDIKKVLISNGYPEDIVEQALSQTDTLDKRPQGI